MACLIVATLVAAAPIPTSAQAPETAGMVGEVKPGRGRVEVKPAGAADWRPARPLGALRSGDQLRASEDAAEVVVLSGGRGSVMVTAARSPYAVPAPDAGPAPSEKLKTLMQSSLGFLSGGPGESPRAPLVTRSAVVPPVVLSPRNSHVLPGPLLIEWVGHRAGRYTFQMLGPAGSFYTRSDVVGNRLEYPAEAPALAAGVRYTVRVVAGSQPAQEAWFEVLVPARAESLRADLGALDQSLDAGTTDTTRVLLGAGLLASNGLMHDARRRVLDALAAAPDEPAFYQALGTIYDRTGLRPQATSAFQEAQLLLDGGRPPAPVSTPR